MLAIALLVGAWVVWCGRADSAGTGSRYGFYRDMGGAGGGVSASRRLFGGRAAPLETWGAVCALLDRYWVPRCSGAVVASRWVLTAGHCITPSVAYVKYNTRRSSTEEGDVTAVYYLYRHPQYRVVQQDEGRGMDVTLLHHDVGLVRTRGDMALRAPPPQAPLRSLSMYDPEDLNDKEVEVLGFGFTQDSSKSEELFAVRLVLQACERGAWYHCMCGTGRASDQSAGVCYGDSGGPVVYRGAQIGVTSMGPLECAADARLEPGTSATSVFTALRQYAPLFNATISEADKSLRMVRLSSAAPEPLLRPSALCACLLCVARVAARCSDKV